MKKKTEIYLLIEGCAVQKLMRKENRVRGKSLK